MKNQSSPKKKSIYPGQLYRNAVLDSLKKFDPRRMVRNPVMFVVEAVSVLTTALWIQALVGQGEAPAGFIGHISLWLWFTILFANFAEALAEGRGKAQAQALKRMRKQTQAKKLSPKEVGYGREYQYAHDSASATTDMETMPEQLRGRRYYEPGNLGFDKEIRKRIEWWEGLKARIRVGKVAEKEGGDGPEPDDRREKPGKS